LTLYIDRRWTGNFGIGRFSTEVISRLDLAAKNLGGGSPTSPLDAVNPQRLALGKKDLVFSPGYNLGFSAARQLGTLHDLIHLRTQAEASLAKNLYYEKVLKPQITKTAAVLTVSDTSKKVLEDWLANDAVSVINVGNGCSSAFRPGEEVSKVAKAKLLYVGNFKAHKNPEVVFRALAKHPDLQLVVVSGDEQSARQLASVHGVDSQVTVVSGVSDWDLAKLYRAADALVFPSTEEGFGLPALEALSCGTPVIYWSGCSSVAEIANGSGIAVASADDADEWAAAMEVASNRGIDAVDAKFWTEKYTWNAVAENVRTAITNLS
jgi:glycosyltransferase involved in cell wall biosynthesis